MLLGTCKPRRLAAVAIAAFLATLLVLQYASYPDHLPQYDLGWSSGKSSVGDYPQNTVENGNGRVEMPSSEGLKGPLAVTTTNAVPTHGSTISSSSEETGTPDESYKSTQIRIQELIKDWNPPNIEGHWPPYDGYRDADYDPNRWEAFDWDNEFYLNNGIRSLHVKPERYAPYPDYNSLEWKEQWRGEYVPCEGARGRALNDSIEDIVRAYTRVPQGFPNPSIGSGIATGIDMTRCYDRYNKFGPYGYGQTERGYVDDWERPLSKPDWPSVPWGQLQDKCVVVNRERYQPLARQTVNLAPGKAFSNTLEHQMIKQPTEGTGQKKHHPRTAVLIRTWEGYDYTENDLHTIRSMITELSLLSGGEYHVFLFVNVKDKNADIWNNQQVYEDKLKKSVPREFLSIAVLWNENIFQEWYPRIGDWQVYWHQFMSLQWFSKTHPEFDFVWNWETDARYTGNHYEFMEAAAEFGNRMPRKYLWERNQRFYFPAAHGTYSQWLESTDRIIEQAITDGTINPVWGPKPYNPVTQKPIGPTPPTTMKEDQFQWGVGEPADLITLQPIWDPTHTEWTYRDKIWNFIPGIAPHFSKADPLDEQFHHPDFANIPRRTYINTLSRFSKKLLHAMHLENLEGRTMQAEMWPATVAIQHGLKAVYAPHPIWTDRKWPAWYMDAVFNADAGKPAQWSQQADSVYSHDREHNFGGWSWYYQSEFPQALYRRWLGWVNQDSSPLSGVGGKSFEDGGWVVDLGPSGGGVQDVGGWGRMCLPPMLLHPVKTTREENDEPYW